MELFDGAGNLVGDLELDAGDDWVGCFLIFVEIVIFIIFGLLRLLYLGIKSLLGVPKEQFSFLAITITIGIILLVGGVAISVEAHSTVQVNTTPSTMSSPDTQLAPSETTPMTETSTELQTDVTTVTWTAYTNEVPQTVFSGPGTNYTPIHTLEEWDIVSSCEEPQNGWLHIATPVDGYVRFENVRW